MSLGANYSGEMNKVQNGSVQAEQHHRVPEMAVLRGCFITIIGTKFTGNVCTRYVSVYASICMCACTMRMFVCMCICVPQKITEEHGNMYTGKNM